MAVLNALSTLTSAATSLSNLILASPQSVQGYQPQSLPVVTGQINIDLPPAPAFMFDYEGEQSATLQSDITDHWVENNTSVQDQVALRPVIVSTQGFIGELNDIPPSGFLAGLSQAAQKLTTIGAYVPQLTVAAQIAYNEALLGYQIATNAANAAVAAWSSLSGTGGESVINGTTITKSNGQNKQQTAFQSFYGYWANRTLFTVQTPWAIFQNMAIQELRPIQSAETNVLTTFEITFKQINFASTQINSGIQLTFGQGRNLQQFSLGVSTGLGPSNPSDFTTGAGLFQLGVAG